MMSPRALRPWLLFAALALSAPSYAEPLRTIEGGRIRLADLVEGASPEFAEVDLGPAPPPGASRLFARDDLARELRSQGLDPKNVKLPAVIRVQSAARRFSPTELAELVRPQLLASLSSGVTLRELKVARALLLSPHVTVGEVRVPKLARRPGPATITAMVDLLHDGEIVTRLPLTLTLEVSQQAALPLIEKGARVDLTIARGAARISASAVALEAAERGEIASFKVSTTLKVLRARVETSTRAVVVTP
jgi:hypothetical protein